MVEVAVVAYARTPIGKYGGIFKDVSAVELGKAAIEGALKKANVSGNEVDEVIMGVVWQAGLKGNPARQAAIHSGITENAPAMTVNQQCSSGIRAIDIGADQIRLGKAKVVVAGGFESMSNVPYLDLSGRWGHQRGPKTLEDSLYYDGLDDAFIGIHMGNTAETVAMNARLTREEVDLFAYESQQKAFRAHEKGRFAEEIVPIVIKSKKEEKIIQTDECLRPKATLEGMRKLPPAFHINGISTAGNSPPLSDGGCALVLMAKEYAEINGNPILAIIQDVVSIGVEPEIMGYGPVPAVKKLLKRNRLSISDIDFLEINEAFGAQALACIKELDFPIERVNVNGGAIALGHPPGNTGARLVGTLITELNRSDKQLGIATLCAGGGPAIACLVKKNGV
ncbi:thiolase family protein [Neobacillus massiliamazoniensis]|uniref:acetyl-CoA C-acetyltransferase n=1 Tax=Neobacillus massiliamazoniensis TaxID=1499688 RepID=A0A0U1P4N6_9BACI|nr:thiolase family protein [Neobacillus massiliamazoniensis]CRK85121.1 acetyl-CoA acetyltransferase [Neobacillus massiliamazoniensis]